MAEYRLEELAELSGVSARNIRAYRERGLLDPPRREGRSAYYNDFHLAQLETIDQLLRKGFNSSHIAEFFASMREGADLADILGLQRAVFGPRPEQPAVTPVPPGEAQAGGQGVRIDVDPAAEEAQQLIASGLAERRRDGVVVTDPAIAEVVSHAPDQRFYVDVILRIIASTRDTSEELAGEVVQALQDCIAARFGANYMPKGEDLPGLSQVVEDYRDLANTVVSGQLARAVQHRMVTAVSEYTADLLLNGQWEPKHS